MPSFLSFECGKRLHASFFVSILLLSITFTHFVGNFQVKCRKVSHLIIQ